MHPPRQNDTIDGLPSLTPSPTYDLCTSNLTLASPHSRPAPSNTDVHPQPSPPTTPPASPNHSLKSSKSQRPWCASPAADEPLVSLTSVCTGSLRASSVCPTWTQSDATPRPLCNDTSAMSSLPHANARAIVCVRLAVETCSYSVCTPYAPLAGRPFSLQRNPAGT
ncbi:hypothetical protein B0H17DRAFT_1207910 [Mycena rosella]|uniref:Uncharacterized protein n=1 Tax=Mycena rosella TaxID=1033263 RepID=A0AAD7D293_MYCRO|nr:hypothetical protein B0H17DRAFT_1207910 [Mycena rosella]